MNENENAHRMTGEEARQGQTVNMGRWVLIFGLLLVVPGMLLVWFAFGG